MSAWARGLCGVLAMAQVAGPVWAGPLGGSVVAGQASIGTQGQVTEIRQSTDRAIINWNGFSSSAGESVRFVQPSAAAVTLNRVTSHAPSSLNGDLSANGRVFVLNPNGITFGATSRVNVGGLVASTLAMSDSDFLAGRHRLTAPSNSAAAAVVNEGHIRAAPGGTVALIGPAVSNRGTIVAPGGRVTLAAGSAARVDLDQGLVHLDAPGAPPRDVVAGTDGSANPLAQVVNNRALVEAGGVVEENGRVVLKSAEGVAVNAGRIEAASVTIDSTQASVLAAGSVTRATSSARVLSRGHAAVLANSRVEAPGGFVEVSGDHFTLEGAIDTRAPDGRRGTVLIDPAVLTIKAAPDGSADTLPVPILEVLASINDLELEATSEIRIDSAGTIDMGGNKLTLRVTGGLGNVIAIGETAITNVLDFTVEAGTDAQPGTQGLVALGELKVTALRDITIEARGPAGAPVTLGELIAGRTARVNAPDGAILDAAPIAGTVNVKAPTVELFAGTLGLAVDPLIVDATDLLSLKTATAADVTNLSTASSLKVRANEILSNAIAVVQPNGTLTTPAADQLVFVGPTRSLDFTVTRSGSSINANSIDTGSGSLTLNAPGGVTGTVNVAGELSLTSRGAGSSVDIVNASTPSALEVHVRDALSQVSVRDTAGTVLLGAASTGLDIKVTGGQARFTTDDGDIRVNNINAPTADVKLFADGGDILLDGNFTAGVAGLFADGDIVGAKPINATQVTLDAVGTIGEASLVGEPVGLQSATGQVTLVSRSGAGGINVTTTDAPSFLAVILGVPGLFVQFREPVGITLSEAIGGSLRTVQALPHSTAITLLSGDLSLGLFEAPASSVTLSATAGSIFTSFDVPISAREFALSAQGSISADNGEAADIAAEFLTVSTNAGDIFLEDGDGLEIFGASSKLGDVDISTNIDTLKISGSVSSEGEVRLTAGSLNGKLEVTTSGSVEGDRVTLSAGNEIDAANLRADDTLTLATTDGINLGIKAQILDDPERLVIFQRVGGREIRLTDAANDPLLVGTGSGISSKGTLDFDLDLTAGIGDLTLGRGPGGGGGPPSSLAVSGTLAAHAPGGAIRVANGQDVRADSLLLEAATGISGDLPGTAAAIRTPELTAVSLAGDVLLANVGAVELGASSAGGDFRLSAGDLTLAGDVFAGGTLALTSAGDLTGSATGHSLTAPRVQLAARALGSSARPLIVAAAELDAAAAAGNAFLRSVTGVNARTVSATGTVALQAVTGDIQVGAIAGSAVRIETFDGRITDGNGAGLNVLTPDGTAGFFATRGVGAIGDALETQAAALVARTATGDIALAEADTALVSATATAGDVSVSSTAGWLVLDALVAGGRADLSAVFGGLLDANGGGLNITAQSLTLALCDTAGTVADALEIQVGTLSASAFGVFVEAQGPLRVDRLDSTFTNRIRATGDLTLGQLTSTQGIVDLISTGGSIVDGNGAALNLVVASGGESRLIAAGTVGVGDALEVQIAGALALAAGSATGGISGSIDGSIAPGNAVRVLEAPGTVLFRGRVQGTDVDTGADEAAALRADPAQSLAAAISGAGKSAPAESAASSDEKPREKSDLIDDASVP